VSAWPSTFDVRVVGPIFRQVPQPVLAAELLLIITTLIVVFFDKRDNAQKFKYALRSELKMQNAICGRLALKFRRLRPALRKTIAAGSGGGAGRLLRARTSGRLGGTSPGRKMKFASRFSSQLMLDVNWRFAPDK
jgi:hypothetical protein